MSEKFLLWIWLGTIGLGVVVAVVSVLLVRIALKRRNTEKKGKIFNITLPSVAVLSLVAIIVANSVIAVNAGNIDAVFTKTSSSATESQREKWKNVAVDIADEGMVLLENNGALPLTSGTKVNLLGYYAYNPFYSGTGSGSIDESTVVSFVTGLENVGIEVNPALAESGIYGDLDSAGSSIGWSSASYAITERSIDKYVGDVSFENLANYSDTAIIVIGRTGGEGADLTDFDGDNYLALNEDEKNLLKSASETFDKLIVVINSGNAIEMGWLNDYDVDAVIWAGEPGTYGFEGLANIITGEANPSGRLPDTWVYDNDSAPSSENFGLSDPTGFTYTSLMGEETDYTYVDYVEGIYIGYKWYETAAVEAASIENTKTREKFDYSDYYSVVKYPFGYGMSYTTFSQEITGGSLTEASVLDANGKYTLEVTVTNTGKVAGKEAVQLYVTVPYTDYDKANHIEKSAVSLTAYGKTQTLEPGKSEVVTLELSMEDLASYDNTHNNGDGTYGSYMLDDGDYVFTVRSDSHNVVDSVTASLSDQYFFSQDNKRESDVVAATNQFDDADRGEYLSRQDGFANYTTAMNSVKNQTIDEAPYVTDFNCYDKSLDEGILDKALVKGADYAAEGSLTLNDMKGADYEDERWDKLISQLTVDDMLSMCGANIYTTPVVESIGKNAQTQDSDGPVGLTSMYIADLTAVGYPCTPILAATFNTSLAYAMGQAVAEEAETWEITGWYAPGMDMHRNALGGRNFEYYSEDSTLSAYVGANETKGARDNGLIVFIKHFALNEQESNRAGVFTFSNEQAIRETYLKPFEYAVKDGNATGLMTSMNSIGTVWTGEHVGLLQNVLEGEWGFHGGIQTDFANYYYFNHYWTCVRAGVDEWLAATARPTSFSSTASTAEIRSDEDIYYLQKSAKDILYMLSSGNTYDSVILDWRTPKYVVYAELIILMLACVSALLIGNRKKNDEPV